VRKQTPVETQRNYILVVYPYFRCTGTYSFIGDGIGKGKKITFAEAWKGK